MLPFDSWTTLYALYKSLGHRPESAQLLSGSQVFIGL